MYLNYAVRFLIAARECGKPVTGPMLESLAERKAHERGIDGFTALRTVWKVS